MISAGIGTMDMRSWDALQAAAQALLNQSGDLAAAGQYAAAAAAARQAVDLLRGFPPSAEVAAAYWRFFAGALHILVAHRLAANLIDDARQSVAEAVPAYRRAGELGTDEERVAAATNLQNLSSRLSEEDLHAEAVLPALVASHLLRPFASTGLIEIVAIPRLTSWRLRYLRSSWRAQDAAGTDFAGPIIDPDLIPPAFLVNPTQGAAASLWQNRRDWIASQVTRLRDIRLANPSRPPLAIFDEMSMDGLAIPGTSLAALAEKRAQGENITADLAALRLTARGLDVLARTRRLAKDAQPIVEAEWDAAVDILVQVLKDKTYPAWRIEEQAMGLTLSTDHFTDSGLPVPEVSFGSEWRAGASKLRDWSETLEGRISQQAATVAGVNEAASEAEEAALPRLRDALALASNAPGANLDAKAGWLSDRLFVDVKTGACTQSNRIAHAVQALQSMLHAARTERFEASPALTLAAPFFDQEWKWIGAYASWRAAMFVFLYPDNILLPAIQNPKSSAFAALLDRLGARTLSVKGAAAAAADYASYYRDVCELKIGASCAALARDVDRSGNAQAGGGSRCFLFMFGVTRGALYWSTCEPGNPAGSRQQFWARVPTGDAIVSEVIGATPYRLETGRRHVYVFYKKQIVGTEELLFARLDLETLQWENFPALELPGGAGAKQFSAVLVARGAEAHFGGAVPRVWNYSVAPQLLIRAYDLEGKVIGNSWHERQFRDQGDGWEAEGFGVIAPRNVTDIHSAVDQGNNIIFVTYQIAKLPDIICFQLNLLTWQRQLINGTRYSEAGQLYFRDTTFRGALIFPSQDFTWLTNEMYLISQTPAGQVDVRIIKRNNAAPFLIKVTPVGHNLPATMKILPSSGILWGDKLGFDNWFAYLAGDAPGFPYFGRVSRSGPSTAITQNVAVPAKPGVSGPLDIVAPLSAPNLQVRRRQIEEAYRSAAATGAASADLDYLKEAFYLVPVAVALELSRAGEYQAALDWFRLVYDYNAPAADRKISTLLRLEEQHAAFPSRPADWLLAPLSPHRIAETRRHCYTRFTVASIARCLRDYGDSEFTRDTFESLPRATWAYETLLEVLDVPELAQAENPCEAVINLIGAHAPAGPLAEAAVAQLRHEARLIGDLRRLRPAADEANAAFASDDGASLTIRMARAREVIAQARSAVLPRVGDRLRQAEAGAAAMRAMIARRPDVDASLLSIGGAAAKSTARAVTVLTGTPVAILETRRTRLPWLRDEAPQERAARVAGAPTPRRDLAGTNLVHLIALAKAAAATPAAALELFNASAGAFVPSPPVSFCVPANPAIAALRDHSLLNLHKLRTCRNIAGMKREVETFPSAETPPGGMPIAVGGQIFAPGTASLRPTQYRYAVLIERAKQLVQIAAQMEVLLLQALEAGEAERYTRFKAQQDVSVMTANIRLQNARLTEATHAITLAQLQQQRAQVQADTYAEWIEAGMNEWERALVDDYMDEQSAQRGIAMAQLHVDLMQTMTSAAAGGVTGSPMALPFAMAAAFGLFAKAGHQNRLIGAQTSIQLHSLYASVERRKQEWELESLVAAKDIAIAGAQITLANDQVNIVTTEREIAEIQANNARDTLEFLRGEFLDDALYDWMSREYERVYGFFLQQATATARLAEQQLTFERQEMSPVRIQEDYWAPALRVNGTAPADTRGLTGSARLLEDIFRLDQHAFTSDRRKLQITKTLSLAQLFPLEFNRFRETGVLGFATPMLLFDRDFPGHYLRLIKSVRVTVVALVPPAIGVKATLVSTGISRVVIGPEVFQTTTVRRDPELIAFCSPLNATGVFELSPQPEMLAPFEGSGVDSIWELRLPKPSNPFNFKSITDVLVSIDYTALNSFELREQVIRSLPSAMQADRAFSLRNDFPDAWYDLHNPELLADADRMKVRLRTTAEDFPSNLTALRLENVLLYFARKDGVPEITVANLTFTPADGTPPAGGGGSSSNGTISTRRGNGGSWLGMIGKAPVGNWDLALPNTSEIVELFKNERLDDILLVLSCAGRTLEWPA